MDLSALIFIALAIAWACYLIPMALRQTDEMARTRTVEHFSSRLRVFGGQKAAPVVEEAREACPEERAQRASRRERASRLETTPAAHRPTQRPSRDPAPTRVTLSGGAAARRAAARRRRVLYVLTALLVLTAGAAALHYVPWVSVAAPVALIAAFLVIARITVKHERAARTIEVIRPEAPVEEDVQQPSRNKRVAKTSSEVEDTAGIDRSAVEALHEDALPDDGSLWDPVPVTLPTYVTKPQARRTVRTIELTHSSGHDAADSKLARDAEAARAASAPKPEESAEAKRRAAGA